jgi:uracil-DNA glycosylase
MVLPMAGRELREIIDPEWAQALEPVAGRITAMGEFLRAELAAGRRYLPAGENVLRAFTQPFGAVRVLIVGQDPYPTPGHAVGLSFSVAPTVRRLPPSLLNIFREYTDDLGYPAPSTGDLVPWSERGVLLLNRVLTVAPRQPASHRGKGWEEVTEQAIRALAARPGPDAAARGSAARRRPADRVRPSQSQLGRPGVLRVAPVQPRQPVAGEAGRAADRLEAPLTRPPLRPVIRRPVHPRPP